MKHDSPSKRFTGYIVLPDNWNIFQLREFEKTLPAPDEEVKGGRVYLGEAIEKHLPAVLKCVTEWHIEGVPSAPTDETFPVLPVADVSEFVHWIYGLLVDQWMGEQVPNE